MIIIRRVLFSVTFFAISTTLFAQIDNNMYYENNMSKKDSLCFSKNNKTNHAINKEEASCYPIMTYVYKSSENFSTFDPQNVITYVLFQHFNIKNNQQQKFKYTPPYKDLDTVKKYIFGIPEKPY